jgi:hypothetical protein
MRGIRGEEREREKERERGDVSKSWFERSRSVSGLARPEKGIVIRMRNVISDSHQWVEELVRTLSLAPTGREWQWRPDRCSAGIGVLC